MLDSPVWADLGRLGESVAVAEIWNRGLVRFAERWDTFGELTGARSTGFDLMSVLSLLDGAISLMFSASSTRGGKRGCKRRLWFRDIRKLITLMKK